MKRVSARFFIVLFPILAVLFPALAMAATDSSLSFTPPAGDVSVVFLGNLFGIVDGVIHGTGSQIMGSIFSVFNAAVLALGGIVAMYIMLVSTVNTAHEGKMLGQKWSSVWVPTRATLGLALLIPKASGYCLMQIFVMWVVVQGVGAADKVWSAALGYMSRGGVIIQPQTQVNPITAVTGGNVDVPTGASKILTGQVCMYGLQNILETKRQALLNEKQHGSGDCSRPLTPGSAMDTFCNNEVPDLIGSVNPVAAQTEQMNANKPPNPPPNSFLVTMPNLDTSSPYSSALNGICGTIQWNAFNSVNFSGTSLTPSQQQTVTMSRAMAVQQLYNDLAIVAQVMVNNDPQLNSNPGSGSTNTNTTPASPVASQQYGVPYVSSGTACTTKNDTCTAWGPDSSSSTSPIFSGTEFQNSIADYTGIMTPSLNLANSKVQDNIQKAQQGFIQQANSQGWMMAGSYFINLALLNSADLNTTNTIDTTANLSSSTVQPTDLSNIFSKGSSNSGSSSSSSSDDSGVSNCSGTRKDLCVWLHGDETPINNLLSLINGSNGVAKATLNPPDLSANGLQLSTDASASTVYGYINNAVILQIPNQPGMTPPTFKMNIIPNMSPTNFSLPPISFSCNEVKIPGFSFCLGQYLGEIFYNILIKSLFVFFLNMLTNIFNAVILAFLSLPLQGMVMIFQSGVYWLQQPAMNPVLALANMGINFINFANELWIYLLELAVVSIVIPWFGIFIMPLIALAMPLLVAWLGTMLAIGFVTAYYVPFLPYMIFTFGSIGWLMAVIEAMVAAPIVALGVTHPEGEGPFGKGEQAIMILMNVFLRPTMMIIGYIAAIALSYVGVWIINTGFANVVSFLQSAGSNDNFNLNFSGGVTGGTPVTKFQPNATIGYTGWAGIYAYFFSILIYTSMYLTVVQKAFTLIVVLPDKVLRWIGGQPESAGQEAAQWAEDTKGKVETGAKATTGASQQIDKHLTGYAMKGINKAQGALTGGAPKLGASGGTGQTGPDSTPSNDG
ncbi:DotA [Legionella beliardensis]|uniref:DotA n=1 Tax=Legionella beliardensis TaxID=91822 RepID=A0A378I541_9GAMM|nr:type IVB secretion system protein DotA [Legionella beliardensis]STX29845.1 DotA [Legionella beliardensis]